ncbi:MAG: isocitrate lyase/phosphoenolpyruvate mutase family protein [Phycisphaerae bacterium]|jgi:phosphoenolpyruvate phosphomutase|nr:isocitrate lyase/phosphoenolpyruvate mutase family protein [Phycisphaerae bacterium]
MSSETNLRDLLQRGKLIRLAGAHSGMTAKLVEKHGFDGVWASGLELSTSHAVPDANILTMTDFLGASAEMADCVSIPIVSDCDTGFGNSNNVMHMVKRFEAAGISAVSIEDKLFPKVNSYIPGRQELAPVAEFVGKIMAAKHAQATSEFCVFARVEALIAGWGIDEAVRRASTYMEAGADGIFIHSKATASAEIVEFCQKWEKTGSLIICPTTYPSMSEKEMEELGIDVVIYANHGLRASIKAMNDVLSHMSSHGIADIDSRIAGMEEVFELQGMHLMKKNEGKYLGLESGNVKAVIPAAGMKIDDSLKGILADRPLAMLDINGKSILQRNVETLNMVGVQDVNVVVGYKKEMVNLEGVNIVDNPDYETKGMMHSIVTGIREPADKNIVVYSDIMFDQQLLRKLLKKDHDIVLVVDRTYQKTHYRDKELELVLTESPPPQSVRTMDVNRSNRIAKIAKGLSEEEAHYEFAGIACFSNKGIDILVSEYNSAEDRPAIESLSFIEFIQYLIDREHDVSSFAVADGWMEVHNFECYKHATMLFS